jgi:hypothetical protein
MTNDAAFRTNTGLAPIWATRSPPRAGPAITAKLNVAPTMALAATNRSLDTTFGIDACSAGWNTAPNTPRQAATV